jgi:hypothetical protein
MNTDLGEGDLVKRQNHDGTESSGITAERAERKDKAVKVSMIGRREKAKRLGARIV